MIITKLKRTVKSCTKKTAIIAMALLMFNCGTDDNDGAGLTADEIAAIAAEEQAAAAALEVEQAAEEAAVLAAALASALEEAETEATAASESSVAATASAAEATASAAAAPAPEPATSAASAATSAAEVAEQAAATAQAAAEAAATAETVEQAAEATEAAAQAAEAASVAATEAAEAAAVAAKAAAIAVGTVDFGKMVVETSWVTEDTGDRDEFTASSVDGEAWMDIFDSGVVKMKCLAEDSHRTELKERSGTEQSLTAYRKMSYSAVLLEVPENGVTVAQIHNRGGVRRPWIRVYIDDDSVIKIKATATTPDEDSSNYDTYDGPEYKAGDEFTIAITTQDGVANFQITTNDLLYSKDLTPSTDWDSFANDYYLKAGVYTEGDDVEAEINFYSFALEY